MTATIHYLPPRLDHAARQQEAWAIIRADLAECIFWVRTYGRALETKAMTPTYRAHIERALASQCRSYRAFVRDVTGLEQAMAETGARFANPHAWS